MKSLFLTSFRSSRDPRQHVLLLILYRSIVAPEEIKYFRKSYKIKADGSHFLPPKPLNSVVSSCLLPGDE